MKYYQKTDAVSELNTLTGREREREREIVEMKEREMEYCLVGTVNLHRNLILYTL